MILLTLLLTLLTHTLVTGDEKGNPARECNAVCKRKEKKWKSIETIIS